MMDVICKLNGDRTTWPCPTPACPLYGDCISEWRSNYYKLITHADHIRNMSDEQLAEFIAKIKYKKIQTKTWEDEYVEVWIDQNGNSFTSLQNAIEYELFKLRESYEESI